MPAISSRRRVPLMCSSASGQIVDQIIARVRAALGNVPGEIGVHFIIRPQRHLDVGNPDFKDLMDPFAVDVAFLLRYAEHVCDHAHRNFLRVVDGRVAAALVGETIDQRATDIAGAWLVPGDRIRCERRQEHLFRRAMGGRIGGDRRRRDQRRARLAYDDAARGEVLGVVSDGLHVGVAAGEISAREPLGACDRAGAAQLVPDRVGVLDPARIAMIEVGCPVAHRVRTAHRRSSSMTSMASSGQLAWAR
jgi:hypothetical protein